MNLKGKKVIGATIFYSLGEIIPRILAFILLPILTRYLSTEEYGINSYITAVMTFMFVLASLSLNSYLLRHYFLEPDLEERKKMISEIFGVICVFNLLLLLLQIMIVPYALKYFGIKIPFYPFFFLGIINNFFDVISIIPLVLFRVQGDTRKFFILSVSRIVLQYIATYIFVVIMHQGLIGTFYGKLIINIPFGLLYLYIILKQAPIRMTYRRVKEALVFSLPLVPGNLSYLILTLSDRIILERFVDLNSLGIYSVAMTIAIALNVMIQALYKTIEPLIFKAYATSEFVRLNIKLYKYYLLLVYWGGFGIALFSKEVFLLLGSKSFQVGYKIVPAMILSVIISGVTIFLNTILIAEKKQKIISLSIFITAVISILLNVIMIPHFGYYGAIIASCSASLVSNAISHYFARLKQKFILSQLMLLTLIIGVPYLFDYQFTINNVYLIFLLKAGMVLLFLAGGIALFQCNFARDWQFRIFSKVKTSN